MASVLKGKLLIGAIIGLLIGTVLGYGSALSRIGSLETQVSTLQGQVASRDTRITALESQLAGNLTLVSRLQTWLSGNLTKNAQLQAQVSTLQEQVASRDAQISVLQNQLAGLQTQLAGNLTLIAQLQAWLSGNLTRNAELQTQVSALTAQVESLTGQVASLEGQVAELQTRLAEEPNIIAVSFSRTEYTRGLLVDWIAKANRTIYVMVMALTADELADALIATYNRGVNVTVIIDDQYKTSAGSDYGSILNAGIDIRSDNSWRLMHHKVMIIDGYIIVTGSYNWSAAAEDDNWENVIIIESETVSTIYQGEFDRMWQQTAAGA